MRRIDGDMLMKKIDGLLKEHSNSVEKWLANQIHIAVNEAPTIDVVHCRDCKHYRQNAEPEYEMCRHHIIYMEPEDWCSYGERMEP